MKNPLGFHACIFDFDGTWLIRKLFWSNCGKKLLRNTGISLKSLIFFHAWPHCRDIKQIQLDKFGEDNLSMRFSKSSDDFENNPR